MPKFNSRRLHHTFRPHFERKTPHLSLVKTPRTQFQKSSDFGTIQHGSSDNLSTDSGSGLANLLLVLYAVCVYIPAIVIRAVFVNLGRRLQQVVDRHPRATHMAVYVVWCAIVAAYVVWYRRSHP